jgi:hypothetical protein
MIFFFFPAKQSDKLKKIYLSVVENGSLSCGFESGSECFLKNDDLNGDLFWIDHTVSTAKPFSTEPSWVQLLWSE